MSITRELSNPQSKASRWLAANFELDAVAVLLGTRVGSTETIRPTYYLKDYPWSTVGHAVEFRLRQIRDTPYFATTASLARVSNSPSVTRLFHDALALLWDAHQQDTLTSRENAWVMYSAGISEGIYRSGHTEGFVPVERVLGELAPLPDWQAFAQEIALARSGKIAGVEPGDHPCVQVLAELLPVSEDVLDDIARVSDTAATSEGWAQITRGTFIDNPVFTGAKWVGGADGDFIVDHTLYDIKCTIHPERLWLGALAQMVSYVALDSQDQFGIDEIGILLPRQHGGIARVSLGEIFAHSTFRTRQEMQRSARKALEPAWA